MQVIVLFQWNNFAHHHKNNQGGMVLCYLSELETIQTQWYIDVEV